jgi:Tfp pilus assembly protein PilE
MTMEAVQYSETTERFYLTTRRYCQKDETPQNPDTFLNRYCYKYISFGKSSSWILTAVRQLKYQLQIQNEACSQ